jgi:mono/diheme cytochrome c family protein
MRPVLLVLVTFAVLPGVAAAAQAAAGQPPKSPERTFLDTYCISCHGPTRQAAGVALDAADVDHVAANAVIWERVVRRLRVGGMPPVGNAAPEAGAISAFVATLEGGLDAADGANWTANLAVPLSNLELATRLASFLWSSWPDDELLDAAAKGTLKNPAILQQQTRRMLKDRRSDAFLRDFFGQWLLLDNLGKAAPSPTQFPEFDDELRDAMKRETELFLESQVREDRGVLDLLTANYTFLNQRLARHYGVANIAGNAFQRVPLVDPARGGLLGQGSVLTITSFANRTSPVVRGKWIMATLLNSPPPPPPANVPPLDSSKVDGSLRDRLERHRQNPVCASCHYVMDPIGFAFENFNAIGEWRTVDGNFPINASGKLPDGTPFNGPAEFKTALVNERRDALVHNVAEKLLAYAIGRTVAYFDAPSARAIVRASAPAGYTWSSMIVGVVGSTPFQMKRLDQPTK